MSLLTGCSEDTTERRPPADAGVADAEAPAELCALPANLETLLGPSELPEAAEIAQLAADGDHVYFSQATRLYRVSSQGGEPEELFHDPETAALSFVVRADHLLVATSGAVLQLPKAGGTPTQVVAVPGRIGVDRLGSAGLAVTFGADAAYFVAYDADGAALHALTLETGDVELLSPLDGQPNQLMLAADRLYWVESAPGSAGDVAVLRSLPVQGGTPEQVEVELEPELPLDFELLATAGDALYLEVDLVLGRPENEANAAVTAAGIYRLPAAGGRAEQLLESAPVDLFGSLGLVPPGDEVVPVGGDVLLRTSSIDRVTVYRAGAQGAAERALCLDLAPLALMTMTADEGALYVALADGRESSILRHVF